MRDAPQPTSRQEPCQGGRGQGGEYGVWTLDSTLNYLPPPPLTCRKATTAGCADQSRGRGESSQPAVEAVTRRMEPASLSRGGR